MTSLIMELVHLLICLKSPKDSAGEGTIGVVGMRPKGEWEELMSWAFHMFPHVVLTTFTLIPILELKRLSLEK